MAGGVACPSLVKDLWDQLAALYAPTGITSQYESFSQALGIWIIDLSDHSNRHGSDDLPITMASQINALTSTYDKISTVGLQLPDNLRTMILLNALPSSYRSLVSTIIQTTTAVDFTLGTIPKVIFKAQLRSTSQINHCALMHRLFTSGPDKSEANQTNIIQHTPSIPVCTHCGKGHLSKNCWQVYGRPGQQNSQPQNNSNRGYKPYRSNRSLGSSGLHHNQNESHHKHPGNNKGKGKSRANVVEGDGFTNVMDMEVNRFGDPDVFHEAPIIENWEFDVEDPGMNAAGPVAGPSSSFRSSSLPPWIWEGS